MAPVSDSTISTSALAESGTLLGSARFFLTMALTVAAYAA